MVVENVPPSPDQGDACEIDVEHWQQVDRAIDLLAEVVIAGHKQEAQALASELRCHIMSLGQNDKLWQLRLANALQQAETLRMELQQTEGNLDQVTKGLEVAESERAAMVEELEMITQQLGSSLEAEKLCMELQELEDAEQNLDEVLKKQAEAAQKSDVVNFSEGADHPLAATEDGQVQSSAYQAELENMGKEHAEDGDEKEVQTDLEEEEEENSSTTTELENTCQEQAEHGDQEAQIAEDQVQADEETASTTTELENVNKEPEEPAQVADEEESPVAEVTLESLEARETEEEKGVEFQDANPAEGEKAAEQAEQTDQQDLQESAMEKCEVDVPKPQPLNELCAAQISEVPQQAEPPVVEHVEQVPKDEMPEGTSQKCEESAIISAMEKAKASIKAKVQITSESSAVQRPVEVPVPKNTSAMQAAEAALAAAARARQVSAQQLRQDEVVPTRYGGPMQDIRIATVRSIGQGTGQANSCTVPCTLVEASNLSGKLVDQAPLLRGDIIQGIPAERSLGTMRTSSPCRVRESMPVPGRGYVQAQPAERSGHRRTVSPSRGHDASRLRETFPAPPKRIIQGTRIVERTGLGNVRTLSPSGLGRDGRTEGLRHTLQGYPQSNLVQGQPERSAQIRTGSPVAMYHRPDGCATWDRSFAKMPTSLTVPPAIPVQPMVLQMAGSFVAPVQPPCLGRSSSFTHIGMPQEQVIVSAPPGSPLLTYREPQRGQRMGSFVAMPMGKPNELRRESSPVRTRWEQDMYAHGRGNYPSRARLPEETQYVGMARLSHHVRQHLQVGGVVETAAPVKHSTKMAL